jgi:lipopolysaccharide export system protein LptC
LNVIFNLPLYARIGLLLIAVLSLWLILHDNSQPIQRSSEPGRNSDYAMTDFTMTIMDINGVPARQIKGDELAHYPDGDRTEIINPVAEFLKPGQDTWIITSDRGQTQGKADAILLTGNVIISNKHEPDFNMLTDTLTLDTNLNTAYTEEPVTIHSPQGVTESIGLHAALDDETINLHSRVKGHYDAPPAN